MKRFWICFLPLFMVIELPAQNHSVEQILQFKFSEGNYKTDLISLESVDTPFNFIGVSAFHYNDVDLNLSYRIKNADEWSIWFPFKLQHEASQHDRITLEANPILNLFDGIEFKCNQEPKSPVVLRLFIARTIDHNALAEPRNVNCELPEICERTCWCEQCPLDNTPVLTDPTHIIIHHSAGFNESNNFSDVVEYYWDLHVNTNGWDDIGYNWLIDANGVIYQGRPDNHQGAHFSCINENTIGICMIGDFTDRLPTITALNSLYKLVAFEAVDHNIDVLTNSLHQTGAFILDNVAGHRDSAGSDNACSTTACPGNTFYPFLPSTRDNVSELQCYLDNLTSTFNQHHQNINIYPNPCVENIFVEASGIDQDQNFLLYDLKGTFICSLRVNEYNDVSMLSSGGYLLVVNGEIIKTIIKS